MNELIRADSEYQREIRRRQFNDKAKIGLLVGMNIQQFHTNQLLERNLDVACQTNSLLGQISHTLGQVAGMQATHFEQVQRERQLKEVMYQFDKFLGETEQCGDPVAAAYGVKRLFEVIDRPGHSFTTADLADIEDKQRFDKLLSRGKAALRSLPKDQFEELEEFERLLGIYIERQATGFNADGAFPHKSHIQLSNDFDSPPSEPRNSAPPSLSAPTAYAAGGCGGCLSVMAVISTLTTVGMLLAREQQSGVQLFISVVFGVPGFFLLRRFLQWKVETAPPKIVTIGSPLYKEWQAKRRREEAKVAATNQKIDTYNVEVTEKRRQATRVFQATMADMRSLINGFLKQHPAIQRFVAPV